MIKTSDFLLFLVRIYTVMSQKTDSDVAHYNFDTNQPILIILASNSYVV